MVDSNRRLAQSLGDLAVLMQAVQGSEATLHAIVAAAADAVAVDAHSLLSFQLFVRSENLGALNLASQPGVVTKPKQPSRQRNSPFMSWRSSAY